MVTRRLTTACIGCKKAINAGDHAAGGFLALDPQQVFERGALDERHVAGDDHAHLACRGPQSVEECRQHADMRSRIDQQPQAFETG
jgi:hypothetical protein